MIGLLINTAAFFLFVFVGSLVMCGWYKATRKGMIFGFWSKFWEARKDRNNVIEFKEKEFIEAKEMKQLFVNSGNTYGAEMWMNRMRDAEKQLEEAKKTYPYKLPEFLVHPLSGCVYCYASVYGSLIFWIGWYALHGYIWLSGKMLVLWIMYMLATCAANGIIIKKVL